MLEQNTFAEVTVEAMSRWFGRRGIFRRFTMTGMYTIMLILILSIGDGAVSLPQNPNSGLSPEVSAAGLNSSGWLRQKSYADMVARHNRFLPEFRNWRRVITEHATEIAALLAVLPNSNGLETPKIAEILINARSSLDIANGQTIFTPWVNRWSGKWSNGNWQFHTWGSILQASGQWIQPVTISEVAFVDFDSAEQLYCRQKVDLAINVFSDRTGITGWVSKTQNGRLEIPHIGYSPGNGTIIWFCQVQNAQHVKGDAQVWSGLVFLENIVREDSAAKYRICGYKICLSKAGVEVARENHQGEYFASN